MEFSVHYPPFAKKTLIAITNNDRARLLVAQARDVEELEAIDTSEVTTNSTGVNIEQDYDAMKVYRLTELYDTLSERMRVLMDKDGYEEAIICVPEANKNLFTEKMHPDVLKRVNDIVPKNLGSMDIGNIVRILING